MSTKYGMIKTDHILFIASGAFHLSKPSDLIPELQGRFPIRVELTDLTRADFLRILTEPKNALVKQYQRLFEMENVRLDFSDDALKAIAHRAIARKTGARGLRSIMEGILLDTMFELPNLRGVEEVAINAEVVEGRARPLYVHSSEGQASASAS